MRLIIFSSIYSQALTEVYHNDMFSRTTAAATFFFILLLSPLAHARQNLYEDALRAAQKQDFDKAITQLQLHVERKGQDLRAYRKLAECYYYAHQADQGSRFLRAVAEKAPESPMPPAGEAYLAWLMKDWRKVYDQGGQALKKGSVSPLVLQHFIEAALQLKRSANLPAALATLKKSASQAHMYNLGYAIWRFKIKSFKKARRTLKAYLKGHPDDAYAVSLLGYVDAGENDLPASNRHLRNALGRKVVTENRLTVLQRLAENYASLSMPDSAEFYFGSAIRSARQTASFATLLDIYASAIPFYEANDRLVKKLQACSASLRLLKTLDPASPRVAELYFDTAQTFVRLQNYEKAAENFNSCLLATDEKQQSGLKARALYGLGKVLFKTRAEDRAEDFLRQAITVARKSHLAETENRALLLLADIHLLHGDTQAARRALENVLRYSQRAQKYEMTDLCFVKLAHIYMDSPLNIEHVKYYMRMANYLALQTLQLQFRANHSWILGQIALNENKIEDAETHFLQAVQLGKETGSYLAMLAGEAGLIETYLKADLPELAAAKADTALSYLVDFYPMYEEENLSGFFDLKRDMISAALTAYSATGNLEGIFESIELYKNFQHLQGIAPIRYQLSSTEVDSIIHALQDNRKAIKDKWTEIWHLWETDRKDHLDFVLASKNTIHELEKKRRAMLERLSRDHPNILRILNPFPPNLATLQDFLGKNHSTFVHYLLEDNATFIVVVTPESLHCKRVNVSRPFLRSLARQLSPLITSNTIDDETTVSDVFRLDTAYQLYQFLVQPVREWLPATSDIIISTDDILTRVPFEALVTDTDHLADNYDYQHADFLIQQFALSYAPNSSFVIQKKAGSVSAPDQALTADEPSAATTGYVDEHVAFSKKQHIITAGLSKAQFFSELADSDLLHLSVPVTADDAAPLYARIELNPEPTGQVQTADLFGVAVRAQTLSFGALQRQLSRLNDRPGFEGLLHALQYNGVSGIVVNLWKAPRENMGRLFVAYYDKLEQGMNTTRALQQAKLSYLRTVNRNPFYWANLVYTGQPVSLPAAAKNQRPLLLYSLLVLGVLLVLIVRQYRKLRQSK